MPDFDWVLVVDLDFAALLLGCVADFTAFDLLRVLLDADIWAEC